MERLWRKVTVERPESWAVGRLGNGIEAGFQFSMSYEEDAECED